MKQTEPHVVDSFLFPLFFSATEHWKEVKKCAKLEKRSKEICKTWEKKQRNVQNLRRKFCFVILDSYKSWLNFILSPLFFLATKGFTSSKEMGELCHSLQLIDGNGNFNVAGLEEFVKAVKLTQCGLSYAVVAIMGPQSSGMWLFFASIELFQRRILNLFESIVFLIIFEIRMWNLARWLLTCLLLWIWSRYETVLGLVSWIRAQRRWWFF